MASQDAKDEKTSLLSPTQDASKTSSGSGFKNPVAEYIPMGIFDEIPDASILGDGAFELSQRLSIRKRLHKRLAAISDIMSALALISIALMIAANELTFNRENNLPTQASFIIRIFITITTVILLGFVLYYQRYSLEIYANNNSLSDIRVGLTFRRIFSILLELVVCAVHPLPTYYPKTNPPLLDPTVTTEYDLTYMPTHIALSLPMFLRLYLLSRSIMYHSDLVRNSSLRSFGYMNKVTVDFFLLVRTYLELWSIRTLLAFCLLVLAVGSWCLRACDYNANQHFSMLDSIWLAVCTFTALGYGEIYPTTYCGRTVAGMIGLSGLATLALMITVLEQNLSLTRQENYVQTFALSTELASDLKECSANIITYAVQLWYLKKNRPQNRLKILRVKQKLFAEIKAIKELKIEKRLLLDNYVGMHEIMTLQQRIEEKYEKTHERTKTTEKTVVDINEKLNDMQQQMTTLQTSMNTLLDQMKK